MKTETLPTPVSPVSLSAAERQTIQAVCNTFFPVLAPEPGDDPRLFQLSTADVNVAGEYETTLALLDPIRRNQFRRLLWLMDQPLLSLWLIGKLRRFRNFDQPDRERFLRYMATSRLLPLRMGFQALKRVLSFLFYSVPSADGRNATWEAIGYRPPEATTGAPAALTLTAITRPTTLECEVCVIGSGAGGGVSAAELARAGKHVIVLEAGSGQQAPEFAQRELDASRNLFLDNGLVATSDVGMVLMAGSALGGGTAVNWQTCLRLPPEIRDQWAELSGCRFFTEDSFTRSLDAVTARLNVGIGESIVNKNNDALRRGCEALGYRWQTIPRNSCHCDLSQCGYCTMGCRQGGKQSIAVTYLADAQQHGDTQIVARCRAERVLLANGRVQGVAATACDAKTGRWHPVRVQAPIVVAAAGAIHSPALLLRSGLRLRELGRNLYLHPTAAVAGGYGEPIEVWTGPPQTILCDEFSGGMGLYGFRLETAPGHPGSMAMAIPWQSAADNRRRMQRAGQQSIIIALVRDRSGGRIRVNRLGLPVIDYSPGAWECEQLGQGMAAAARIHAAAGAHEILAMHTHLHALGPCPRLAAAEVEEFCRRLAHSPMTRCWCTLFSAHQMGTCRMGRDRRRGVCDENGQVFGVCGLYIADGSAFPASSGVNPMITIMALAHHTAQRIKARW